MKRITALFLALALTAQAAQQVITPGEGVTLAAGRDMINANFTELYAKSDRITLAASKTFTVSNTITLTATDGSTLAIGGGGTLGTAAYTAASAYQAADADLTTWAGITPSANVQTLVGAANFAAFKTSLSLNNVENTALSTWAGSSNITTAGALSATSFTTAGAIRHGVGSSGMTILLSDTTVYPGIWFGLNAETPALENVSLYWDGTRTIINAPTGGVISFRINNAGKWIVNADGHLMGAVDGTVDIGALAATRPRDIHTSQDIKAGRVLAVDGTGLGDVPHSNVLSYGLFPFSGVGMGMRSSTGRWALGSVNNEASSSCPGFRKNGTTLEFIVADNSGFTATQSLYERFGTGSPEGAVTAPVGASYHRTDGSAGTSLYVKESGTGNTGWVAK